MSSATAKLDKVQKTLLVTLYGKALDHRSADPIVDDRWADEVLRNLGGADFYGWSNIQDCYLPVLRAERMDRWARNFLDEHPDAVVVQLACGLDSRALRLDLPAGARWFDVDFPEVVELRREHLPITESEQYQVIASSVTAEDWLERIPADRPTLVIAEGLMMYLGADEAWRLLDRLTERFPRGELVFDVLAPWAARFAGWFGFRMWGLGDAHEVERAQPRLSLLEAASAVDGCDRVPRRWLRAYLRFMSRFRFYRTMVRPLRFRLEARG
jgi:O-methyltransferase involved in polyketide biosynthesis